MASQKMARPKTKGIMASMMVVVVMMMMIMVLMTEGVRAEENSVQRLPPDSLDMRDGQKFAYVTLLYNDGVLEGARVLGHSLVKTGTPFDRVAIVTETCSPVSVDQLQMDGWLIHRVGNMPNPHQGHHLFQKRLDMVFSKLHIYNLTSYDKIVYLDTDILVLENVDELFGCPGFCANVRNGFFNTGVMVIRPSEEMFLDLVSQSGSLPSYNGGEQGLMNSYFPDFDRACPMFRDETGDDQRPTGIGAIRGVGSGTREALRGQKCARLPAYYNGDIGPYYLHNARWNLPDAKTSPKILHFTLGHFKPWQWWAFVPFDVFWIWHDVHTQLPPRLPHFRSDLDRLFDFLDFLIPPALTALVLFLFSSSSLLHRFNSSLASRLVALSSPSSSSSSSSSSSGSTGGQPMELGGGFTVVAMVYQFGLAFVSVGVPFMITFPKEFYHPLWGWLLTFEWFVLMLVLLYGHMLRVLYLMGVRLGQRAAKYNEALRVWSSPSETSEALIRRTVTLFMIMVFYLVVVCVDLNQSHPGNLGGRFLHTYIESGLLVIYLSALMSWLPRSWVHQGRLDSLDLSKAIQLPLFSSSLLYPLS